MAKNSYKCKHCKDKFTTYKKNAIFCSSSCRNLYSYATDRNHPFRRQKKCKHCKEKISLAKLKTHEAICLSYDRECKLCKKEFRVTKASMYNIFCGQSCAAIYNNSHRKTGIRRSKLEFFIEKQLLTLYPKLKIDFNKISDMGGFELDIHIPSLKLAFEINGIVHYKNIYGQEKYERIKNNDRNKMVKCTENGVNLIVIDTMEQSKFSEESSQKYLKTICQIVDITLAKEKARSS